MKANNCLHPKCYAWARVDGYCVKHTGDLVPKLWCEVRGCTSAASKSHRALCVKHGDKAKLYGLSEEVYLEVSKILECQACGAEAPLVIDHDHACCPRTPACGNCYRGMICQPCNLSLGMLKDSPERIMGLLSYIQNA